MEAPVLQCFSFCYSTHLSHRLSERSPVSSEEWCMFWDSFPGKFCSDDGFRNSQKGIEFKILWFLKIAHPQKEKKRFKQLTFIMVKLEKPEVYATQFSTRKWVIHSWAFLRVCVRARRYVRTHTQFTLWNSGVSKSLQIILLYVKGYFSKFLEKHNLKMNLFWYNGFWNPSNVLWQTFH